MRRLSLAAGAVLAVASVPASAHAQNSVELTGDLASAVSTIVVSDTNAAHGSLGARLLQPRYSTNSVMYNGVVDILMRDSTGTGYGLCSGSVIGGGRAILTAAHCVANTSGPNMGRIRAGNVDLLYRGAGQADVVQNNAAGHIFVKPGYTGNVVDPNDVAVILLDQAPPPFAVSYQLFSGNPFDRTSIFTGFGQVGDGNTGDRFAFQSATRLGGLNSWEASRQGNFLYDESVPSKGVLVYDFDNGSANRNTLCLIFGSPGGALCNLGFGQDEVALGRGDSGGPGFINVGSALHPLFQIAGVASWVSTGSQSNGAACGTGTPSTNTGYSCFGAIGGHTDITFGDNAAWITSVATPEPATWALMGTGLLVLGGIAARRRRDA